MIESLFIATLGASMLRQENAFDADGPDLRTLEEQLSSVPTVEFGAGYEFDDTEDEDIVFSSDPAFQTFLKMDPQSVPDHILLAVLLAGATNRNPVLVAEDILKEANLDLRRVGQRSLYDRVKGVGPAGMARVLASRELSRRIDVLTTTTKKLSVTSPLSALRIFQSLSHGPYEILSAIFLNKRRQLIGSRIITKGNSGFTIVDPRQIMEHAIELGASAIIMAHQHPSGDPTPSQADHTVTRAVAKAGNLMSIPLLDHLVVTPNGHISFAELGYLPSYESKPIVSAEY